ncbi:MAG: site-2 protease family protein [Thaumarchaeota archaeon]|nr:site-2 protease family protein [Nitrososphaerota archaeon]
MGTPAEPAEKEKSKAVELHFPLIMVRTKRGLGMLDTVSRFRLIKPLSWVLLYVLPVFAAAALLLIFTSIVASFSNPVIREIGREISPRASLLIPGLNPFIPIVYGWIALVVALVIHEGAHGVQARALGLPVKSAGLLLFLGLPIGAFVEIDEKEMEKVSLKNAGKVLAAGPGSNMVIAAICLGLLILTVGSMTPLARGVGVIGVFDGFPAQEVGMSPGDIIVSVNNIPTPTIEDLAEVIGPLEPGDQVNVSIVRGDSRQSYLVSLAENPVNRSRSFLGVEITLFDFRLDAYQRIATVFPLIYLVPPTIRPFDVPYSDVLHMFYTSSIGPYFYPVANLLFWIWFVNFNVGVFNALPIYPLDGGQVFRRALKSASKGRLSDQAVKRITIAVALIIVGLILTTLLIPYIDLLPIRL